MENLAFWRTLEVRMPGRGRRMWPLQDALKISAFSPQIMRLAQVRRAMDLSYMSRRAGQISCPSRRDGLQRNPHPLGFPFPFFPVSSIRGTIRPTYPSGKGLSPLLDGYRRILSCWVVGSSAIRGKHRLLLSYRRLSQHYCNTGHCYAVPVTAVPGEGKQALQNQGSVSTEEENGKKWVLRRPARERMWKRGEKKIGQRDRGKE